MSNSVKLKILEVAKSKKLQNEYKRLKRLGELREREDSISHILQNNHLEKNEFSMNLNEKRKTRVKFSIFSVFFRLSAPLYKMEDDK